MFGGNQMPPQIEQIVNGRVGAQKPLRLMSGLESPHAALSDPRWLVRELGSIVGVLGGVVDCIRDKFTMSNTVTPQLVGDDTPRFITTHSQ